MYIKKLTAKFGSFVHPECKTLFDPFNEEQQLDKMIPNYRAYANNLVNKKSTSNSDLTYKIVKTADNNLSIFKKNDKSIQQPVESIDDKAQHVERKHAKNSTNDAIDDLKYQVMKRDKETSRVDGRVDSVILKRKAESPIPANENRKKMRLLTNNRRMSTPNVKELSNNGSAKNVIDKVTNDCRLTITKTDNEQLSKVEKIDRKSSKLRETPSKDVASKEDLISAVVKKLDTLEAFVSTNDNCKLKGADTVSHSNKMPEPELTIESVASNNTVDKQMTVIKQRNGSSNSHQVIATNLDKSKSDEDENLLVPMHDPSTQDMNDSKKELQMSTITSSRQGSMSGSSIQSVTGSLDDPFEISIKTEPLSGDESSMPNNDDSERIMSPLDNRSLNGLQECNFSKISVKNINTMTRPLDQMDQMQRQHIAIRKLPPNPNKSSKEL